MTPDQVEIIADRMGEQQCHRDDCGSGECQFSRSVIALCEEWGDQRAEIERLRANDLGAVQGLKNLTASFEICDDCGANACDDAKPDGPHILCHDCAGKHKALHAERDALDARVGEANVEHAHLTERTVEAESARDSAVARAEQAEARFADWSGTDVPALNIALTQARAALAAAQAERDHYKGIIERDGGQEVLWLITRDATVAALSEARRVLDECKGRIGDWIVGVGAFESNEEAFALMHQIDAVLGHPSTLTPEQIAAVLAQEGQS